MTSKSKVYFFFDKVDITLKNRRKLKTAIEYIFKKEKKSLENLNCIFCTDTTLLNINKQYLKHDFYTDIITFDLSEDKNKINGEIYISIDRVRENSIILRNSFSIELFRVIFHGALHLCGYSDKKIKGEREMRKKEDYYLTQFK